MKLVDILARELTEWPLNEFKYVVQEGDGELYFYKHLNYAKYSGGVTWLDAGYSSEYPEPNIFLTLSYDWQTAVVSQQEWQSARAAYLASIQPARDTEIAAVVDKPANPWRRNRGRNTPPVADGVLLEIKMRNGYFGTCFPEAVRWDIKNGGGDIMQWRYAEPQQAEEKPMAQTIEQVIENAEAAAAKAFDPIALRDEFQRITADGAELSQKMAKLNERMAEIEAALRAEGFAIINTEV